MNLNSPGKNVFTLISTILWTNHSLFMQTEKKKSKVAHQIQPYVWFTALDPLFINHCY